MIIVTLSIQHPRPFNLKRVAIQLSWNSSDLLKYDKILLDNIISMPRTQPYSSTVSIIQSSGYGKSRMVNEMANRVFALPFNLRDPRETKGVVKSRFINRSTDYESRLHDKIGR